MRFVRQSQMIRVTNFDDSLMIEKKNANIKTCHRFLYTVPSTVRQTAARNVLISWKARMAYASRVYIYSKSLQQPKYQYLKNLLAPIEEIV